VYSGDAYLSYPSASPLGSPATMAATTSLSRIVIWNRVAAHLDNTDVHQGLPPSPYLAERREHPPQPDKFPAFC
jgi:hypothetical protein